MQQGVRIAYVAQEPVLDMEATVFDSRQRRPGRRDRAGRPVHCQRPGRTWTRCKSQIEA